MAIKLPRIRSGEFIISQLCMIGATIAGVYLAASEGLKSAIEFQLIESDRASYHQQTALAHELQTNTAELEQFINLWKQPNTVVTEGYLPSFDTFVWQASIENPVTFEISPPLLLGMVAFHREVNGAIKARLGKKISRKQMMEKLIEQRDKARNETLPGLEKSRDSLRRKLKRYDVFPDGYTQ